MSPDFAEFFFSLAQSQETLLSGVIEVVILTEEIIKKPYGNIYYYQSKKFLVTRDFNDSLGGNGHFLVEKTGRVVAFGTSMDLEDYIKANENGTLGKTSTRFWYPDEDRFDYK